MDVDKIRQKIIDSLVAKHLHVRSRNALNLQNQLIDALALTVPIIYLSVRFIAKGTPVQGVFDAIGEILAAVLIASTVWKLVYRLQDKIQEHSELLADNIAIVEMGENLLSNQENVLAQAQYFSGLVQKSETDDRRLLGEPAIKDKQFAYREALKEFGGANVTCPICNSSPFKFTPGSCQTCGNKPTR